MCDIILECYNLHRLDIDVLDVLYGVEEVTVTREEADGLDRGHLTIVEHLYCNGHIHFSLHLLLVRLLTFAAGKVLLFVISHVYLDSELLETHVEHFVLSHAIVVVG
jgi:hypothetical protein